MAGLGPGSRFGGAKSPSMGLDVPISEGQICCSLVVRSRKVRPPANIEMIEEISVVDAVRMFFDEDENARRLRDLAELEELRIIRIIRIRAVGAQLAYIP